MNEVSIIQYISKTFAGADVVRPEPGEGSEIGQGDTFFIYDPDRDLEDNGRFPFATIVTKDYGDFDDASNLNRPGVFRLNIGISRDAYRSLFGTQPSSPDEGGVVDTGHDFTALDQMMPRPVYAPQSWVCVLNPGDETFQKLQPLLAEVYERAVRRYAKVRPADES